MLRSPRASSRLAACPISATPLEAAALVGGVRVECGHSVLSCCLRLRAPERQDTKPRGAAHATRASCAPPTSKAWHRGSPSAPSVRETISLGMSESTRGRRMTPRLAPVAFEDLTVPRAAEGGKSDKKKRKVSFKIRLVIIRRALLFRKVIPRIPVPSRLSDGRLCVEQTFVRCWDIKK